MRAELFNTTQPFSSPQQSTKDDAVPSGDPLFAMLLQMMGSATPQALVPFQDVSATGQSSALGVSGTTAAQPGISTQATIATLKSALSGIVEPVGKPVVNTSAGTAKASVSGLDNQLPVSNDGQSNQQGLEGANGVISSLPFNGAAIAGASSQLPGAALTQAEAQNVVQTNPTASTPIPGDSLTAVASSSVKPTFAKPKSSAELTQSNVPSQTNADASTTVQQNATTTLQPLGLHAVMFKASQATTDSTVQPTSGDKSSNHAADNLVNQSMSSAVTTTSSQSLSDAAKAVVDVRDPSALQDFAKVLSGQISAGDGQLQVQVKPEGMGDILISVTKHDSGILLHIESNNLQMMSWIQQGAGQVQTALAKSGIDVQGLNISYGQAALSNGFSNTAGQQDGGGKNSSRSQSSKNSVRIESTDGIAGSVRTIAQAPDIQAKYFTAQA